MVGICIHTKSRFDRLTGGDGACILPLLLFLVLCCAATVAVAVVEMPILNDEYTHAN